jgi:kinesin family protein C2/C3
MAPADADAAPLEVRAAADGGVTVPKLRTHVVTSAADVDALLLTGGARRHTHGTLMNATSSRSHLVLTLHATCTAETDGTERCGKLHLVDLAGSERVGKSGVVGEQLKEAQHINKSLSALEQVRRLSPCTHSHRSPALTLSLTLPKPQAQPPP